MRLKLFLVTSNSVNPTFGSIAMNQKNLNYEIET